MVDFKPVAPSIRPLGSGHPSNRRGRGPCRGFTFLMIMLFFIGQPVNLWFLCNKADCQKLKTDFDDQSRKLPEGLTSEESGLNLPKNMQETCDPKIQS